MLASVLLLALVATPALAADAVEGVRIAPLGVNTGVQLANHLVVGEHGGTNATSLLARYRHDRITIGLGLPFANYRLPDDQGRATDVGNVLLEGWYLLSDGSDGGMTHGVGLEAHINLGSRAWSWVNEPTQIWPGTGADLVWQGRSSGDLAMLYRASVGVHSAQDFEPFPRFYLRMGAAVGIDYELNDRFGLTAEGALTYWDPSPLDVAGMVRVDIIEQVRGRLGLVLPMAVWVGATPSDSKAGIREVTLVADLRLAL